MTMDNTYNANLMLDVISDDKFALCGFLNFFDEVNNVNLRDSCCVLISTHPTLLSSYSFFKENAYVFSIYKTVIVIASQSVLDSIESTYYISSNCLLPIMKKKLEKLDAGFLFENQKKYTFLLTPAERRVLKLILEGVSQASIAKILNLKVKRISHLKRSVMDKYEASSTVELIMKIKIKDEIELARVSLQK